MGTVLAKGWPDTCSQQPWGEMEVIRVAAFTVVLSSVPCHATAIESSSEKTPPGRPVAPGSHVHGAGDRPGDDSRPWSLRRSG